MPALFPAPKPRFSCSTTRASGNFSRTISGVSSVELLSTTITSAPVPRRLSRERSIHGAALWVTTTAETSGISLTDLPRPTDALPGEDHCARDRHEDGDDEEEKARRKGAVAVDSDVPEEADEERLADGEPVERERHEHDEEEERAHHVVGAGREVDPHRLAAEPDRQHPGSLHAECDEEHDEQDAHVVAVRVHRLVDLTHEPVEPDEREHWTAE